MNRLVCITLASLISSPVLPAQDSSLPPVQKVRNYLPHMTVPEVRDFLTRSDMVIIPVASLEQHGLHLPIGTDYLNGVERAKRIAQRVDVLVAPILLPGQSPYHMGFEGTITLPSTLIQEVYVESATSLMRHGFKRFLILNSHRDSNTYRIGPLGVLVHNGDPCNVNVTSKPRTVDEALTTGERFVGTGYREVGRKGSGVFRSADGTRQFRMTNRDLTPTHGKIGPHVHLEKFDAVTGKKTKNIHVPLSDR